MKFGPEVDDALGGRLEGIVYQLPNHCAAILRALLLCREPARLHIGMRAGEEENEYILQFHATPMSELGENLNTYQQMGFFEEKDLSRAVSTKNIRAHLLRRGMNAGIALIQKTNASAHKTRVFQTIAFLPRLLPGLFVWKPLSETEKALLAAAFKEDCDMIETHLETLYKESDLCNMRQKRMLHDMISYSLCMDLSRAREGAQQHEHNAGLALRNYMDNTNAAMEKKVLAEDIERRIGGMSQVVDDVMDFMNSNKAVTVTVNGSKMYLDVVSPLANFDADAYRVIRRKSRSIFLDYVHGCREDALLFFDALFLKEKIKVMFGARYSVEGRYGVTGIKGNTIPGTIPNPHIHYYGCLGQYAMDMQAALSKSDFVDLISLCIASGLSLNIPETPVFSKFARDVTGSSQKVVLLPDGEAVTYQAAVAWIKQSKGIKEEVKPDGETDQNDGNGH